MRNRRDDLLNDIGVPQFSEPIPWNQPTFVKISWYFCSCSVTHIEVPLKIIRELTEHVPQEFGLNNQVRQFVPHEGTTIQLVTLVLSGQQRGEVWCLSPENYLRSDVYNLSRDICYLRLTGWKKLGSTPDAKSRRVVPKSPVLTVECSSWLRSTNVSGFWRRTNACCKCFIWINFFFTSLNQWRMNQLEYLLTSKMSCAFTYSRESLGPGFFICMSDFEGSSKVCSQTWLAGPDAKF